MQEPVLANLGGYPVLVRTPEGSHISLRGGAAVAGPGFERYVDNHTLCRVSPTAFTGPIVYETPVSVAQVSVPKVPQPVAEVQASAAEGISVLEEMVHNLLPEEIVHDPVPPPHVSPQAPPNYDLKYSGPEIKIPENARIQIMPKAELVALSEKLGFRTDGSRAQLVSRLQPLSGRTIQVKKADQSKPAPGQ